MTKKHVKKRPAKCTKMSFIFTSTIIFTLLTNKLRINYEGKGMYNNKKIYNWQCEDNTINNDLKILQYIIDRLREETFIDIFVNYN